MPVDNVVMGGNPLLNALLLSACIKRGQSVLLIPNRVEDFWPYQLTTDPRIQFLIANAAGLPKTVEAEAKNTALAYQPPSRRWSDLFLEQLIAGLRVAEPSLFGMVPEGYDAAVEAITMMGKEEPQTIVHVKPMDAGQATVAEQKQKLRSEINLPNYSKSEGEWQKWHEDFRRYAKPLIKPIKVIPVQNASQVIIPQRLLLTSQDNRFTRVASPDTEKSSLTRFHYELPGVEAFGTAAWASHDPQIVIEHATEDILRATRYGLPSKQSKPTQAVAD